MSDTKVIHADPHLVEVEYQNDKIRRNNLIFAILTLLMQIAHGLLYGFLIRPFQNAAFATDIFPIINSFAHAILAVVGFGLWFSYMKRLVWSGLGFSFLIVAMTVQMYFLINAALGWAALQNGNFRDNGQFPIEAPEDLKIFYFTMSDSTGGDFGNTIIEAFKCSIANVVAFSAVLGRAGPLEAWFLVLVSTVGYQFNRTLLTKYAWDGPGTMHIFLYAGTLGLVSSLILRFRERKQEKRTGRHLLFTASKFSSTMGLMGTVFIWVFLPVLGLDPAYKTPGNSDGISHGVFTEYLIPLNIVFGLLGSTVTSICMSALLNGQLAIRDVVYGPITGGIAVATAGTFITNPVYALLLGVVTGGLTSIAFKVRRGSNADSESILYSYPIALFIFCGLLGSAWSAWNNAIIVTNPNAFNGTAPLLGYQNVGLAIYQFWIGLLTIAFGIGFGIVLGLFYFLTSSHTRLDHFTDSAYWMDDDGISYASKRPIPVLPGTEVEMQFYEGDNQIKNIHAYL